MGNILQPGQIFKFISIKKESMNGCVYKIIPDSIYEPVKRMENGTVRGAEKTSLQSFFRFPKHYSATEAEI